MKARIVAPHRPGQPALDWWAEFTQLSSIDNVTFLPLIGGAEATMTAISRALREPVDVLIWSGHGAAGALETADGFASADWLACQLRQAPPGVLVLAACHSGDRDPAAPWLDSIAEAVSQSGINCIGMWTTVRDRAAILYNVEFLRALATGAGLAFAHKVAIKQMALAYPDQAGAAYLLPGLLNGYGKIEKAIGELHAEMTRSVADLRTEVSGSVEEVRREMTELRALMGAMGAREGK